jgi:hypothetical protein
MKKALVLIALFLSACSATHVTAQTPQPVQLANSANIVMNAVTAPVATPSGAGVTNCPAVAGGTCQLANAGNYGAYTIAYTTTGVTSNAIFDIRLEASYDGMNWFAISEDATNPMGGSIQAYGYFPAVRLNLLSMVNVTSVTAFYSSVSGYGPLSGQYNPAQQLTRTVLANAVLGASNNYLVSVTTPFANSYGTLVLRTLGTIASGGTLTIFGLDSLGNSVPLSGAIAVPTASSITYVPLPPLGVSNVQVQIQNGGAAAGTVSAAIIFSLPPMNQGYLSTHITTNTNTLVKTGAGLLHNVTINTAGSSANTITIKDSASGTCATGTVLATIDSVTRISLPYDLQVSLGICVITGTGTAADVTITYR